MKESSLVAWPCNIRVVAVNASIIKKLKVPFQNASKVDIIKYGPRYCFIIQNKEDSYRNHTQIDLLQTQLIIMIL